MFIDIRYGPTAPRLQAPKKLLIHQPRAPQVRISINHSSFINLGHHRFRYPSITPHSSTSSTIDSDIHRSLLAIDQISTSSIKLPGRSQKMSGPMNSDGQITEEGQALMYDVFYRMDARLQSKGVNILSPKTASEVFCTQTGPNLSSVSASSQLNDVASLAPSSAGQDVGNEVNREASDTRDPAIVRKLKEIYIKIPIYFADEGNYNHLLIN